MKDDFNTFDFISNYSQKIDDDKGNHKFIVVEAALLIEASYFDLFDEIWVIDAKKEIRIKRLMESRGYSLKKCEDIIASQNDVDYYCLQSEKYIKDNPKTDYKGIKIIQNNTSIRDLTDKADKVMEDINGRI